MKVLKTTHKYCSPQKFAFQGTRLLRLMGDRVLIKTIPCNIIRINKLIYPVDQCSGKVVNQGNPKIRRRAVFKKLAEFCVEITV